MNLSDLDADSGLPPSGAVRADWRVVVVGAGPAGLVAAITLARLGVEVLVVDRRPHVSNLARALVISTRSMEIFRAWGLEAQIRAGAADVEPLGWVTRSLAAGEGTEVALGYPTAAEAAEVSPTRPAWAPQDRLEPLLLQLLRSFSSAEVRFGCELLGLREADDGVRISVRMDRVIQELRAEYVIGADGAHSAVRSLVGIRMHGPDDMGEFHRVEFRAPLAEIVGERRYGLYLITNPEVGGVVAPRGAGDRWGLSREATGEGQLRIVAAGDRQLHELIATAAGVPDLPSEIERTNAFFFSAQIAERYRRGRVFIVGDAAHRMTPRGGTGMNTAIQDAFDIGWKLAWVLGGWSSDRLLDTYEAERRPVGLHNVERAAQPDGARQDAKDALPWDLYGRIAHRWVQRGAETVSTLDLLGDGYTLFTGPDDTRWSESRLAPDWRAPLTVHQVDREHATALGIQPTGAILVRPDGKEVGKWWSISSTYLAPRIAASSHDF